MCGWVCKPKQRKSVPAARTDRPESNPPPKPNTHRVRVEPRDAHRKHPGSQRGCSLRLRLLLRGVVVAKQHLQLQGVRRPAHADGLRLPLRPGHHRRGRRVLLVVVLLQGLITLALLPVPVPVLVVAYQAVPGRLLLGRLLDDHPPAELL